MRTRLFLPLILVGISYTQSVNLDIVEQNRQAASLDNDIVGDWADLDEETALAVNANNVLGHEVQNDDRYEAFGVERDSDEDDTATLDDTIDDNENSEFEIHINSVEDEGNEIVDDTEEDEDEGDDPCLSEPDLPECNDDEEREPPTIL